MSSQFVLLLQLNYHLFSPDLEPPAKAVPVTIGAHKLLFYRPLWSEAQKVRLFAF
jgi:hypothetical protein